MTLKLAGVVGLDPGPLTLAELLVMGEGKREHDAALFGELWALIANCHRDPKKRPRPFEARDLFPFLPRPVKKKQVLSPEQKAMLVAASARKRNGQVRKVDRSG